MAEIKGRVKVKGSDDGFNGVKITLIGNAGSQDATTASVGGKDGVYSFGGLAVGEYTLKLDVRSFERATTTPSGDIDFGPVTEYLSVEVEDAAGVINNQNFLCIPFVLDAPDSNEEFDLRFMMDLLSACTAAIPIWMRQSDPADPKKVDKARKRLRKILCAALRRKNESLVPLEGESQAKPLDKELAQQMRERLVPMRKEGVSADDLRASAQEMAGREISDIELHNLSVDLADMDVDQTANQNALMATCTYCWSRYNTPGTIYYQNTYYLNKCLYDPPCS